MATCSDFWEGVLKLLNFALGTLGLIMLGYGVYLLVKLNQVSGGDENIPELFQLSRNLLMELGFPNNFANNLSKTWFVYLLTGVGAALFIISLFGYIGAVTKSRICLSLYIILVMLLILIELIGTAFILLDPHWKDVIRADKTGYLHEVYSFLKQKWKAMKWFALGVVTLEMHRFVIHAVVRPKKQPAPWILSEYIFGHKDLNTCEAWVKQLNSYMSNRYKRPKKLLVLVHPLCGKRKGVKTWEMVAPIFCRAKVETKVIMTERAGHAYDVVSTLPDRELRSLDGIVTVGGDGLFNEVLNGLLPSRHKASFPPPPIGLGQNGENYQNKQINLTINAGDTGHTSANEGNSSPETSCRNDDHEPLLPNSLPASSNLGTQYRVNRSSDSDEIPSVSFPNDWFRLGLIPAGSTDAIVLSTTGVRDPVTSTLHIILGSKMSLDIAQVVRWKTSPSSVLESPTLRYAASFAGYGFYGDVIKESEKLRWMGPMRYDYAGTMAFLKHKTYEAEITYLEPQIMESSSHEPRRKRQKQICLTNCTVCNQPTVSESDRYSSDGTVSKSDIYTNKDFKWSRVKGHFLSVGAAVISCRNERAPDGLVADAHLSDGFLHLILVKDCPHPYYLWHLTQLTKRGSDPLNYSFIEHHKTPAFTFVSQHDRSLWNLDGEILQACHLSVQACRGLINLFASGPEV